MEIITENYQLDCISTSCQKYFDEETLFFDIECTGLSPKTAFVYLIGCASRKDNIITTTQFFAEGYEDERSLLNAFNQHMGNYKKLLGFNSTRFDESFLMFRFKKYGIESKLPTYPHLDLYLKTTKAKVLLDLENYKQKTMERFLGLDREDTYNGGELIPVYNNYTETKDAESKNLVLLHNLEDVKGMVYIIDILSYVDLLNADITNIKYYNDETSLHFELTTSISIPRPINKHRDYGTYVIKENKVSGSLNLVDSILNTYLNDYKNYYYLINEDIIIPKVLGEHIEKENKRNATRADCKIPKEGKYLQIPKGIVLSDKIRVFKKDYSADERYISIDDVDQAIIKSIFIFMLKH